MNIESTFGVVFLIGRIIASGFFVTAGINHFTNIKTMSGYAQNKGTPAAKVAVGGTGVLLLVGGLSLLLGYHPTFGTGLLVIFLLGVSFKIHDFWVVKEPQQRMAEQVNFMKNMALIGFLLMTVAIPRPWPMSLGR
jgi:putative oxidoreductase